MLTEEQLVKKISLTYDQWQEWLSENTPPSWDSDLTLELLAYYGFVNFMSAKQSMPDLDLEKLDILIFGTEEESLKVLKQLAPVN